MKNIFSDKTIGIFTKSISRLDADIEMYQRLNDKLLKLLEAKKMYNITVFRGRTPFLYFFRWSEKRTPSIVKLFSGGGFNVEVVEAPPKVPYVAVNEYKELLP
jgi:hypothetical protein